MLEVIPHILEGIQSWYCWTTVTFTLLKATNLCSCHKLAGLVLVTLIGCFSICCVVFTMLEER